ncbi:hypothetical protein XBFM1_1950001 [Xenorhabdus bovienii str. feltiae Moldova]|uniref:Uncharacterized protein n=1 Tax=Xenorhabdus bovienii str. feltiae Moldova TaxID=1398200 RepID=A0A077NR52_XENBV|nr:hypothetical protein XBFM1_1950001 [Xenorhabdus bovienii str. feltiae Moldova]
MNYREVLDGMAVKMKSCVFQAQKAFQPSNLNYHYQLVQLCAKCL